MGGPPPLGGFLFLNNINNMASNVATNLVTQQTTGTQPQVGQTQAQQPITGEANIAAMNPTEAFVAGANAVA